MRAPASEAAGTSGESLVQHKFESMGWAAIPNPKHDLGTDLLLRPRDERRYELPAIMGAQVKTGASFFREPRTTAEGNVEGWWFRDEDASHFDYWCGDAMPHILVLVDPATNDCYWVHVVRKRVLATGKGAKILVPRANLIGADHRQDLTDVATSAIPSPTWHGTAWAGASNIPHADLIRHALLTPRLIAPHPNAPVGELSGFQALAMLILGRPSLGHILAGDSRARMMADNGKGTWGLTLDQAETSPDWGWRAVAVMRLLLFEDDASHVEELLRLSTQPGQRVAAIVIASVSRTLNHDVEGALVLLDRELERDDQSPIDHAWLLVHRARCLQLIGSVEEAREVAVKVQRCLAAYSRDATAGALAASGAEMLFGSWHETNLATVITNLDSSASWWRAQQTAWGGSEHLDDEFKAWAHKPLPMMGGSDSAGRYLASAYVMALMAGDERAIRTQLGLYARHQLTSPWRARAGDEVEHLANQLDNLRQAGDRDGINQAVPHICAWVSAAAVRAAASTVSPERSTHTSADADLALLIHGADLLPPDRTCELAEWTIDALCDPEPYTKRTRPTFDVRCRLLEVLQSLTASGDSRVLRQVWDYLRRVELDADGAESHMIAHIIDEYPPQALTAVHSQSLKVLTSKLPSPIPDACRRLLRAISGSFDEEVLRRLSEADLSVIPAVGDITGLPNEAVRGAIAALSEAVRTEIAEGASGHFANNAPTRDLAVFNLFYPELADWAPLVDALNSRVLIDEQLRGLMRVLARLGRQAPDHVRADLACSLNWYLTAPPRGFRFSFGLNGLAAEAILGMDERRDVGEIVARLLGGNGSDRESAAALMSRSDGQWIPTLIALGADPHPRVRRVAAYSLGCLVTREVDGDSLARRELLRLFESPGTGAAGAAAGALTDADEADNNLQRDDELITVMATSLSASIRHAALDFRATESVLRIP
ncbi:protein of unknown function [Austwickia chelonae]|uniref:DUF4365 domain-containing protein n=1 Tax=Austwickia chelonae NBRC 105200 TaxID=1184607 RepID=K6UNJ3_9MICO|nr:DUF4365 domain-containing protein [Austwickia chelonae]GAB79016.1 hypothetical protein AUCHE_18_00170 [Austwickia chelonae NBRC 105200]SEW41667.1 protein of unknown function [Austwickia chelonae]